MQYTIESIDSSGKATVRYPDGSWAEFMIEDNMDADDVDHLAFQFRPKTGVVPSFLTEGESRTAAERNTGGSGGDRPDIVEDPEWLANRKDEYGTLESQIEYIVENGLAAWQSEVAAIKAKYPKE